jgi:hypothetical protein
MNTTPSLRAPALRRSPLPHVDLVPLLGDDDGAAARFAADWVARRYRIGPQMAAAVARMAGLGGAR